MLTDTFLQLVNKYSDNNELATNLWLEIFTKYSEPKRHYHTIEHLEAVINDLVEIKKKIENWYTTLFAVFTDISLISMFCFAKFHQFNTAIKSIHLVSFNAIFFDLKKTKSCFNFDSCKITII